LKITKKKQKKCFSALCSHEIKYNLEAYMVDTRFFAYLLDFVLAFKYLHAFSKVSHLRTLGGRQGIPPISQDNKTLASHFAAWA
jgi:capsule polysaccharide modification protein KpsS